MDDLTAFITARLDEDEAMANEIHLPRNCGSVDRDGEFDPNPVYCGCHYPARVLREVTAKRAILAEHQPVPWDEPHLGLLRCPGHGDESSGYWTPWPCTEVRAVTAVWSDHPDYRAEWAPER